MSSISCTATQLSCCVWTEATNLPERALQQRCCAANLLNRVERVGQHLTSANNAK